MKVRAFATRTLGVIVFHICGVVILQAQPVANSLLPKVDKRMEIVCIASRLADIEGFNSKSNPVYEKAIASYFKSYSKHPFVILLRDLKRQLDTMYWEIPAVAAHLSQPPALQPVMDFRDTTNVDGWESRLLFNSKFVALLRQFYVDSKADVFFQSQENYYRSIEQRYESQAPKLNKDWFPKFFGIPVTENYFAILAPGMKEGAYMRVNFKDNHRDTFTFFTFSSFDGQGIPAFEDQMFPRTMLHEYVHTFTNQLVDKNINGLHSYSEVMLKNPKVFPLVENTFYGNWQFLLYESMVRACAIKYLAANKELGSDREKEIVAQEKAGFLWMRSLVKELDNYEANRPTYKSLDEYMPGIISRFKTIAAGLQ